ncbi:MAG: phosphotransferase [Planctomycetes bacterium]|nr:phosphotransferase [Planctomycetota bacterium]
MTSRPTGPLTALLAAVPTPEPGTELILRPHGDEPIAILRPDGRPPRVFAWRHGNAIELAAADDTRLPGHRLLADRALLQRLTAPLLGPIADSSLVAWRPGRRAVLRVRGANGRTLWLKLLDKKTWRRAVVAFAAFADHDDADALHFARPLTLLDEHAAYLAPHANGIPLRTWLAGDRPTPLDLLRRALSLLATTPTTTALPATDFATARAAAIAMLDKGAAMQPQLAGLAAAIATMTPPPANRGFVHGDLHDKQVFLDEAAGRATLIDLEGVSLGDPTFDLVNLAEHLRLRDLQQQRHDTGLADAVLAAVSERSRDELLPWQAVIRARLCGVYALRPRWTALTAVLREEAATLVEACRCAC